MRLSRRSALLLRAAVAVGLAFIYIPLIVIVIYAFNASNILEWPPPGLTLDWFPKAIEEESVREAFVTSLEVGAAATAIALLLGTLASLAVSRHRFFGRETISFLVILPIALPGIVTGVALSNTFTQVLGISLGLLTVVVSHATFCIVVVYNNAVARLRRLSTSFEEASADLGAHTWQTFRFVTLPQLSTALAAGGLLAFALSFDEIIVTNFTIGAQETLPIWIFRNLARPHQLPIVNAVAVIVVLFSIIPVYLAHRLTREEGGPVAARGGRGVGATRIEGGGVETAATAVP
jgi:putative spermidine/putrescine transport system permease protein